MKAWRLRSFLDELRTFSPPAVGQKALQPDIFGPLPVILQQLEANNLSPKVGGTKILANTLYHPGSLSIHDIIHIVEEHLVILIHESKGDNEYFRIVHEVQGWATVGDRPELKLRISELSVLLDQIVTISKKANIPQDQAAITEIDRAQLVAMMETTLAILKSPMVEVGLLTKVRETAAQMANKLAIKQSEKALGRLLEKVPELVTRLLDQLGGG